MMITTKGGGDENTWVLGPCQGTDVYGNDSQYTENCCLPPGSYNLECKDSLGDGWQGGYIELNGTRYCETFNSGKEEITEITMIGGGIHYVNI